MMYFPHYRIVLLLFIFYVYSLSSYYRCFLFQVRKMECASCGRKLLNQSYRKRKLVHLKKKTFQHFTCCIVLFWTHFYTTFIWTCVVLLFLAQIIPCVSQAALRKICSICGTKELHPLDLQQLVQPQLMDSFLICSNSNENFVWLIIVCTFIQEMFVLLMPNSVMFQN